MALRDAVCEVMMGAQCGESPKGLNGKRPYELDLKRKEFRDYQSTAPIQTLHGDIICCCHLPNEKP